MPTLANLKTFFSNIVAKRDRELKQFQEKLATDPVHAFVWAESTMKLTAQGHVAEHYLRSIGKWEEDNAAGNLSPAQPQTEALAVDFIHQSVMRQAIQRNCYVERSTSTTSNFMKAEENAFYAELANEWEILYA